MSTQQTENSAAVGQSELSDGLAVTTDELREVCELVVRLTELRQNECKHLCVENFAPELFHKLLTRFVMQKQGMVCMDFGIEKVKLDG